MCMVREPGAETRISHNQLVCVRRGSGNSSCLGLVLWLRVTDSNEVLIGVRLFPGSARAVAARPAAVNAAAASNGYERGLLLPGQPAPPTPATLILPAGWYQPERRIELHGDRKQIATLGELLEKGSDFERCTFTLEL